MIPLLPSSAPRGPGLGSPVEAILALCWIGDCRCRYGCAEAEKASACVRFGVDDRDAPEFGSSGGAKGDRIEARECGEGIVAVGGAF